MMFRMRLSLAVVAAVDVVVAVDIAVDIVVVAAINF
jgi:hypothetical protein